MKRLTRTVAINIDEEDFSRFLKWVKENNFKLGAEVGKLISVFVNELK